MFDSLESTQTWSSQQNAVENTGQKRFHISLWSLTIQPPGVRIPGEGEVKRLPRTGPPPRLPTQGLRPGRPACPAQLRPGTLPPRGCEARVGGVRPVGGGCRRRLLRGSEPWGVGQPGRSVCAAGIWRRQGDRVGYGGGKASPKASQNMFNVGAKR